MYNDSMFSRYSDTRPEIEAMLRDMLRKATPAQKMAMAGQMYATMKVLALVGLRERHPDENPAQIRRRLADLLLGAELAEKVYGPGHWKE